MQRSAGNRCRRAAKCDIEKMRVERRLRFPAAPARARRSRVSRLGSMGHQNGPLLEGSAGPVSNDRPTRESRLPSPLHDSAQAAAGRASASRSEMRTPACVSASSCSRTQGPISSGSVLLAAAIVAVIAHGGVGVSQHASRAWTSLVKRRACHMPRSSGNSSQVVSLHRVTSIHGLAREFAARRMGVSSSTADRLTARVPTRSQGPARTGPWWEIARVLGGAPGTRA